MRFMVRGARWLSSVAETARLMVPPPQDCSLLPRWSFIFPHHSRRPGKFHKRIILRTCCTPEMQATGLPAPLPSISGTGMSITNLMGHLPADGTPIVHSGLLQSLQTQRLSHKG